MYDAVIIGCGPGGYAAANRISQLGGKAAIVEASDIGGTCVNRGCIPSKIWMRTAYLFNIVKNGRELGLEGSFDKINYKSIVARKNKITGEIRVGMEALLRARGVEILKGHGAVKNACEVSIDDKSVETKNIIIATGSYLKTPDINGFKEALLTPDEVLDMPEAPSSVLVWGEAGPIDIEMAALLNILGSNVCLATPHQRILPMEDHDSSQRLEQAFREQGIQVLTRSTLKSVEKTQKNFNAYLAGREDQIVEVEKILFTGREPYTAGLGLEQAGVQFNEEGNVLVNENLQTSVTGIYAVGDITGGWMNSHAASAMAVTAAENAMGRTNEFPFHLVPRGIWTFPQIGAVGLTEEQAEKKGFEVEVGDFPYSMNGLAMCHGELAGSVKIVSEAGYGEILGIHIVGANATELVGEAVLALQLECTADDLAHSIRVHPTFSEALMDAGRDASGWK